MSERRVAILLRINRKTVIRKALFLGVRARYRHQRWLEEKVKREGTLHQVQFDEMETFERSKCLPLSIPLIVVPESRVILGLKVASMPATGMLAKISVQKYGKRADERASIARLLWNEQKKNLVLNPIVLTDKNPKYSNWIKPHFTAVDHQTVKGRRGCVVGQGELKKIGFDPLFSLNHTAAMLRANINRLFRRTWCTTKRPDYLELRLNLYTHFHNQVLLKNPAR